MKKYFYLLMLACSISVFADDVHVETSEDMKIYMHQKEIRDDLLHYETKDVTMAVLFNGGKIILSAQVEQKKLPDGEIFYENVVYTTRKDPQ